jgi:hypothetical protein
MRIRTVKPDAFRDQWLLRQEPLTRWVLLGLVICCDDSGKFEANRDVLRGQICPCDPRASFNAAYEALLAAEKIVEFGDGDNRYGIVPMFAVHQRIDKPQRSEIPNPPTEVAERVLVRLTTHAKWKAAFRGNLLRMIGETEENIRRVFAEDSKNVPGTFADDSCASRARASGNREEEEGRGKGEGPTHAGTELRRLYGKWAGIHEECGRVSLEKFAEIVRVNTRADLDWVLDRLTVEMQGQVWPHGKNAAQVLRSRVVYADVDKAREQQALGNGEKTGGGEKTAEELRAKADGLRGSGA